MVQETHRSAAFWNEFHHQIRDAILDFMPTQELDKGIASNTTGNESPVEKTAVLVRVLDHFAHEHQQDADNDPNSLHSRALHMLGVLQMDMKDYLGAEATNRKLLTYDKPGHPNLNAMQNLGLALLAEEKFDAAEPVLSDLQTQTEVKFGRDSTQALACLRFTIVSLAGCGKKREAKQLYNEAMKRIEALENTDIKKDELAKMVALEEGAENDSLWSELV